MRRLTWRGYTRLLHLIFPTSGGAIIGRPLSLWWRYRRHDFRGQRCHNSRWRHVFWWCHDSNIAYTYWLIKQDLFLQNYSIQCQSTHLKCHLYRKQTSERKIDNIKHIEKHIFLQTLAHSLHGWSQISWTLNFLLLPHLFTFLGTSS